MKFILKNHRRMMFTINIPVNRNEFGRVEDALKQRLNEMEFEIVKQLYNICPDAYTNMNTSELGQSDKPWTTLIFDNLSMLAKKYAFHSFPIKDDSNHYCPVITRINSIG